MKKIISLFIILSFLISQISYAKIPKKLMKKSVQKDSYEMPLYDVEWKPNEIHTFFSNIGEFCNDKFTNHTLYPYT